MMEDRPDAEAERDTRAEGVDAHGVAASASARRRILVVDDDTGWLEFVAAGLRERGYAVSAFDCGLDLLQSEELHRAEVVVADYSLPDIDGIALCGAIHEARPSVRTILCSGHAELDVARTAMRMGLADYLIKPLSLDELDSCIQRLCTEPSAESRLRTRRLRLETGKTIPGTQYRIDGWIGEGGMGIVYRGTHLGIDRRVALKVLHPEHCQRAYSVRTFRNEARASARIGAPNIVDILDFAELSDGRLLIAMEYLEGQPLDSLLRQGPVPMPRLFAVARQLCKALGAAHEAGIVHRDVKPDNIILTKRDGREDFVKIFDFGIAAFECEQTGAQPIVGTPQYMAPESIVRGEVTALVDIYALGCVLYELATGAPPFDGSPEEILAAQVEEDPPPMLVDGKAVPTAIERVVQGCLAKDPLGRFHCVAELEYALCEAQIELDVRTAYDDLPLPDVEPQRRTRLAAAMPGPDPARRGGRWRSLAAAAALAVACASATGVALTSRGQTPPEDAETDEIERKVEAATLAASRMHFVYPPASDPDLPTAYTEVVGLEALGSTSSITAATALRTQFAETLVQQGDRYWEFDHGRGFAREFYAMATLFDAGHPRAVERSGTTLGMASALRERASRGEFEDGELRAAETLRALAHEDAGERERQLDAVQQDEEQSVVLVARLERLRAESSAKEGDRPRARPKPRLTRAPPPVAAADADEPEHSAKPGRDAQRRGSAVAAALGLADDARRSGRSDAARKHYHRALEADPHSLTALDGLASLHFDAAEYSQAVRYARLAAERGGRKSERWLLLGDAYFKVLRYEDAQSAYGQAKRLGSRSARGRIEKVRRTVGRVR